MSNGHFSVLDKTELCVGCGACVNRCPRSAIVMTEDAEGFLVPKINLADCDACGLCEESCPVLTPSKGTRLKNPSCFAVMADDRLRRRSSSGGVFPILAEYVLEQAGVVCGAAYDDTMTVRHLLIRDITELEKLKGAKYAQSDMGDCFSKIQILLDAGTPVLFSGTPCQVAGLKSFLQKDDDRLFCVDLVCRGVPSPGLWRRYLRETLGEEPPKTVNFHDKSVSWREPRLVIETKEGKIRSVPCTEDPYCTAFYHHLSLRRSCGSCPFNTLPRQGDLTLGGAWGIGINRPDWDDGKGTSTVLVNNAKGKRLFSIIQDRSRRSASFPLRRAVRRNPPITEPVPSHPNRDRFFFMLKRKTIAESLDYCLKDRVDVLNLNFWQTMNYGAILTAFALQRVLSELGFVAKALSYVCSVECRERFPASLFARFAEKHLAVTEQTDRADLSRFNKETDSFIVGSDQVWNAEVIGRDTSYLLDFPDPENRKIAVSASFGNERFEGLERVREAFQYYLPQFDRISVRESSGVNICRDVFDVDAVSLLDPVFSVDRKVFDEVAAESGRKEKDFTLYYFLEEASLNSALVDRLKASLPAEKVFIGTSYETSVEDWLYAVAHCRCLLTDSFHGVCFAVIFHRDFIYFDRGKFHGRVESLLDLLSLRCKMVKSDETVPDESLLDPIDYSKVNSILQREKERFRSWLLESLTCERERRYDFQTRMLNALFLERHRNKSSDTELYQRGLKKLFFKVLYHVTWGKTRKAFKKRHDQYKRRDL